MKNVKHTCLCKTDVVDRQSNKKKFLKLGSSYRQYTYTSSTTGSITVKVGVWCSGVHYWYHWTNTEIQLCNEYLYFSPAVFMMINWWCWDGVNMRPAKIKGQMGTKITVGRHFKLQKACMILNNWILSKLLCKCELN